MTVSLKLANEIFRIEFWHILSLLLSIGTNYYIFLKARKTALLYTYLLAQSMLIIWLIAKILKTVSPTIELRWFFIVMQYFGASFLGACLFLFAFVYRKSKVPQPLLLFLIFLPAAYCFVIVATNPFHSMFYSKFTFYSDRFGRLFYVNMAITYTYLMISFFMLARGFVKMFGAEKVRAYLFATAILFPFIINIFYVFRLFKWFWGYTPLFDYTPISTNISLMLFALAAMKYRFFDILPMAKRQVFVGLSDAVVICSQASLVCDYNKKAISLFPGIENNMPFSVPSSMIEIGENKYKVIQSKTKRNLIFRYKDITAICQMLSEVQQKNEELTNANACLEQLLHSKNKLVSVKADNFIRQELHDVLGHAIVLAVSACEIEILSGAANYEKTLLEIKKLLVDSQSELRHAFSMEDLSPRRTSLFIAIDSLIRNTSSSRLKIHQTVQGSSFELDANTSQTVFRICQEAITNSLKHSHATEIHIVFRYTDTALELFIVDNGEGCETITYGRGLTGMQDRLESLGGSIRFSSGIDCGFHIHALVSGR